MEVPRKSIFPPDVSYANETEPPSPGILKVVKNQLETQILYWRTKESSERMILS